MHIENNKHIINPFKYLLIMTTINDIEKSIISKALDDIKAGEVYTELTSGDDRGGNWVVNGATAAVAFTVDFVNEDGEDDYFEICIEADCSDAWFDTYTAPELKRFGINLNTVLDAVGSELIEAACEAYDDYVDGVEWQETYDSLRVSI